MIRRRPDLLALFVAIFGTVAVLLFFLGNLMLSRERELDAGERRIEQFGKMLGEHTARSLGAVDILLRGIAADLTDNHPDWEEWTPAYGWEYVAQRHAKSLPQLRDLIIFDREGNQRFISTYFPPPRINVRDRPYFVMLEAGQQSSTFGPYVGRNSGRYTYALAQRINDRQGRFAGAVFAAIEPAYFHEFCWENRLTEEFESVMVNAKGVIVASCRPTDLTRQSPLIGVAAEDGLYGGLLRGWLPESGSARERGLIVSLSAVPDFPDLRVLTALPEANLLAAWRNQLSTLGILAAAVVAALFIGGLLVRRQVSAMNRMTDELADSHESLEQRVSEATAELSRQKREAEQANRAKSRFLAAASHDLRQPLHALALFASDLQHQVQSGERRNLPRLAEQIAASTGMLGELFDSLLDISRLDVAGVEPDRRAFPVGRLLERLVDGARRTAVGRQQTLAYRPSALWVESDPLMLERMVANLLNNALRYTQPGGRILVAARRRGAQVLVEVRDNGPGIAPEEQEAIFTEFYQVGNPARESTQGLGLGLSIVERLAHALGVEVRLRSSPGRGTTFGLLLPAATPATVQLQADALPDQAQLLLIGESPALVDVMEFAGDWNYPVRRARGAEQVAMAAARDCIVITTAAEAAAARAAFPPDTPVVALADDVSASLPGNVYALAVPVRPAKLRALLEQLQKTLPKSIP
ncbi:MAG: ATP-binding protein [Betaproteobacteria bacterium]